MTQAIERADHRFFRVPASPFLEREAKYEMSLYLPSVNERKPQRWLGVNRRGSLRCFPPRLHTTLAVIRIILSNVISLHPSHTKMAQLTRFVPQQVKDVSHDSIAWSLGAPFRCAIIVHRSFTILPCSSLGSGFLSHAIVWRGFIAVVLSVLLTHIR